jgi:hypothetical protein
MWRFLEDRPISPHLSIRANPFIKSTRNFKRAKGAEIMDAALDIKQPSPGMLQMPNPYMPSLNSSPMQFLNYYTSRASEDKGKVMNNYMNEMVQTKIRQAMFKQLYPISSNQQKYDALGPENAAKLDRAYQKAAGLNSGL